MPFWLQITAALSAALSSGVMGAALVPFLKKMRFCEPEHPDQKEKTAAKEQAKPTMCGLLIAFGILFGMVLSFTLYREFGGADLTSLDFAEQSKELWLLLGYALLLAVAGFVVDVLTVRRRLRYKIRPVLLLGAVFLVSAAILSLHFPMGIFLVSVSVLSAVCWKAVQSTEHETDGVAVTVSAVQLLVLTVQLLVEQRQVIALYTLTAAGACLGCMVWNLHPAKCRLGCTGSYLLGAIVPMVCIIEEWWKPLALCMAVYALELLPLVRKQGEKRLTLLGRLAKNGTPPWKRIALLAGAAVFCGILAVIG